MDSNASALHDSLPGANATVTTWSFSPVFTVISTLVTVTLNAFVLGLLLRRDILAQPFTLYLLNLLVSNLLWILIEHPLDIVYNRDHVWWLGEAACTLFLYANYVLSNGVISAQILITINRLWAVSWPVHYRHHHTQTVAALIILAMWAFSHLCLCSGILLDAALYRRPVAEYGCMITPGAPPIVAWGHITQWLNFNVELLFSVCAYFYIWHRRRTVLRARLKRISPQPPLPPNLETESAGKDNPGAVAVTAQRSWRHPPRSQSFLILTLLTWSMFANQIPASVYFTALFYVDPSRAGMQTLFTVSTVCLSLQSGLNPVLFAVAMHNVRASFGQWLHTCQRVVRRWAAVLKSCTCAPMPAWTLAADRWCRSTAKPKCRDAPDVRLQKCATITEHV